MCDLGGDGGAPKGGGYVPKGAAYVAGGPAAGAVAGSKWAPGGSGSIGGINVGDPLDLFGGGKRRAAAAAEKRARAEEDAKQAAIDKNVAGINTAFDGRGKQYADFLTAMRTQGNTELNQQRAVAERENKFALARSGNTGGSVAIDRGRDMNRDAANAALAVERSAQGGVAALKDKDETSRMNLIQLATTGGNIGSGAQQAAKLMENSLNAAQQGAGAQGLGDLFSGVGKYARDSRDRAEFKRGVNSTNIYGSSPATSSGFSGPR